MRAHASTGGGLAQVWSRVASGAPPACLGAALVPTAAAASVSRHAICDRCACASAWHCGMGLADCRARACSPTGTWALRACPSVRLQPGRLDALFAAVICHHVPTVISRRASALIDAGRAVVHPPIHTCIILSHLMAFSTHRIDSSR